MLPDTQRAEYRFKVAESGDGKAWISAEPLRNRLPIFEQVDAYFGLELHDDSFEHVTNVVAYLNKHIKGFTAW